MQFSLLDFKIKDTCEGMNFPPLKMRITQLQLLVSTTK